MMKMSVPTCFDHNSSKSTNFSLGHRCLKHNSTRSRCCCKKEKVQCVFSCRNKPKLFSPSRADRPSLGGCPPAYASLTSIIPTRTHSCCQRFPASRADELISTSFTGPLLSKALLMSFLKAAGHSTTWT